MSSPSLPINPDPGPGETRVNIYGYTPWLGLGIVSVIIFAVGLAFHVAYAIRAGLAVGRQHATPDKRQTITLAETSGHLVTFETLFSFGCALEVVGYAFRTASSRNPFILTWFILNYFMIVVVRADSQARSTIQTAY